MVRGPVKTVLDATRLGFWAGLDHALCVDGNLSLDGMEICWHCKGQGCACGVLFSASSQCFLVPDFLWIAPHGAWVCEYCFAVVRYCRHCRALLAAPQGGNHLAPSLSALGRIRGCAEFHHLATQCLSESRVEVY